MAAFVNVQKKSNGEEKKSMKRTKIVCTMGPKTENVELLKEMIKSGRIQKQPLVPHSISGRRLDDMSEKENIV